MQWFSNETINSLLVYCLVYCHPLLIDASIDAKRIRMKTYDNENNARQSIRIAKAAMILFIHLFFLFIIYLFFIYSARHMAAQ